MKNKGFGSEVIVVLIAFLLILFSLLIVFSGWPRFRDVYNAKTPEEIKTACMEYGMSPIKNIPSKCLPYLNSPVN